METDQLAKLIEQKHAVLTQLKQLTDRQSELIRQRNMTRLLSLLAAKQKLLMSLQNTERLLDPFRQQDPESRTWRTPATRQRARAAAAACEQLLSEIVRVEQECESALVLRRDEVGQRLQGEHHASQARAAYVQSMARHGGQLDVSSES